MCTAISLLSTVLVEVVIILRAFFTHTDGWGMMAAAILTEIVVLIGFSVNCTVGVLAQNRKEYLGLPIAMVGIAVWIVTVVSIHYSNGIEILK